MDDRQPMTPARLADALEKAINDPDTTADMFGEYARRNLPTILAALRSTGTGRSEAEAMRERCAAYHDDLAAQHDAAISVDRSDRRGVRHHGKMRRSHEASAAAIRAIPTQAAGGGDA